MLHDFLLIGLRKYYQSNIFSFCGFWCLGTFLLGLLLRKKWVILNGGNFTPNIILSWVKRYKKHIKCSMILPCLGPIEKEMIRRFSSKKPNSSENNGSHQHLPDTKNTNASSRLQVESIALLYIWRKWCCFKRRIRFPKNNCKQRILPGCLGVCEIVFSNYVFKCRLQVFCV